MDSELYNNIRTALLHYGPVTSDDALRAAFLAINDEWRHSVPEARNPAERVAFLVEFLAERSTQAGEPALALFIDATADSLDEQDVGHATLRSLAVHVRHFVAAGGVLSIPPEARHQTELDAALSLLQQLPTGHIPAPDRSSLPPHSRLGLDLDPNFTGREDELLELARELKEGNAVAIGQPVAVSGLGGMGKSSLASAFVYRYGRYFAGGVFWLSFADPASIAAEIADAGSGLDLPAFDALDLPEKVAATRRAWESQLPRLLIFDNCEDETLIDQYKPIGGGSRVLITSHSAVWTPSRGLHHLHLDTLPRPDSIAFLRKLAPRLTDAEADAIAAELGDFPLALHLAGSYLARYKRVSPAAYAKRLQESNPLEHPSLRGRSQKYTPTRHELDVHKTFLVSLDRLDPGDSIDALARDLLLRAACFAPGEPIPHDLLLATLPADDEMEPEDAEDAFQRLLALGLLEPATQDAVRLHRLLAAFLQLLGVDEGAQIAVEKTVGHRVAEIGNNVAPAAFAPVLPHLRHAATVALHRAEDPHSARLCGWLASLLATQGDYAAARPLFERALAIREQALGPDHPDTALSLNNLAGLLHAQGDYAAARPLYERALAICEQALGPDHPTTAASLNNLAYLLHAQGDYAAARPLYERALAIREQALGPDHPSTAASLNNLASLLYAQGDYAAARPLYERALAIAEKSLGPDHPNTAQSLNNLAALLDSQGDYAAARPLYERALAIREQALGPAHPDTATGVINLALLLQSQGDYAAARSYCERSLAICEQALGPDHPTTAASLNNLAGLLDSLGDFAAARPLYERALAIAEKSLGPDHPSTATSLNNLASLLDSQGDYAAARSLYERALAIKERALGPDHPSTATSLNNLAVLLDSQGDYAAARPLYERALAIAEQSLGPDHPDTRLYRSNLDRLHAARNP